MHLIVQDTYKDIESFFEETFYCMITHATGDKTIDTTGRTTSLDMSKDTDPDLGGRKFFFQRSLYFFSATKTISLSNNDQVHQFFSPFFFQQRFDDLVDICLSFRNKYVFSPGSNATMQCDIAGISPHHFNDKDAVMRIHGIPDLIDRF